MERKEINKVAGNLIDQAKLLSKEKFLNFTNKMYGTDGSMWAHLWNIPIVPSYDTDVICPLEFDDIEEDDRVNIIDEHVETQLGESEAVFIRIEDLVTDFPDEIQDKYFEGVMSGEINAEYDAVIVYNEATLKNQFGELLKLAKDVNPPKSEAEIKDIFLNMVAQIFTHERMHLNVDAMVIYSDNTDMDAEFLVNETPEDVMMINGIGNEDDYLHDHINNNNEVVVDVVSKIIHEYNDDDSIEDCLYRIIQSRKGKSMYKDIDDREILSLFTLFPEELTRWTIFEAYEDQHTDLIAKKQAEVFGANKRKYGGNMLRCVSEYFNNKANEYTSQNNFNKRKTMLEMLGVNNICDKNINVTEIRELATSKIGMAYLDEGKLAVEKITIPEIDSKSK